jgi:hypothetical protein
MNLSINDCFPGIGGAAIVIRQHVAVDSGSDVDVRVPEAS